MSKFEIDKCCDKNPHVKITTSMLGRKEIIEEYEIKCINCGLRVGKYKDSDALSQQERIVKLWNQTIKTLKNL